jgi:Bax protein
MTLRRLSAIIAAVGLVVGLALVLAHPWSRPGRVDLAPDFEAMADPAARKAAFFRWLAPVVQRENQRVLHVRERLLPLAGRERLSRREAQVVQTLADHYRVDPADDPRARVATLLRRVDAVPPRLALAQAAIESGWGTSRFARDANNYFGIWTWSGDGLVPEARADGASHTVARYPDAAASVRVYLFTLNVGDVYRPLRDLRASARAAGRPPRADVLAAGLVGYSERREAYVAEVRDILAANEDLLDAALEGR